MSNYTLSKFTSPNAGVAVSTSGTDQSTTAALGQAIQNIDSSSFTTSSTDTLTNKTLSADKYDTLKDTSGNIVITVTAGGGVQIGAPTGGDKGSGTVNTTGVYSNGTLVGSAIYKELGKGTATGNQAITSTASPGTDITGLSVTCTPDGTHDVIVRWSLPSPSVSAGVRYYVVLQKGGVVQAVWYVGVTGSTEPGGSSGQYVDAAPAASSTIYKLSAYVASAATLNTVNQVEALTTQNNITVEQIG